MTSAIQPTGPADLRDQRWLDERVADINNGIDAVLDIAANWTAGRDLSRLHPGVSAQDYILARVPSPLGPGVIKPLLVESNWSNRQIAAVAGVSHPTVAKVKAELESDYQFPVTTLGADGKERPSFRPRLADDIPYFAPPTAPPTDDMDDFIDRALWRSTEKVIDDLRAFARDEPASLVAQAVPERRRAGTAKTLRQLGTYLGSVALALEEM